MGPITLSTLLFRLFKFTLSLLNIDIHSKEKKIGYQSTSLIEIGFPHTTFMKEFNEYQLMTVKKTLLVPNNTPIVPTFFKRKDAWLDEDIKKFEEESSATNKM